MMCFRYSRIGISVLCAAVFLSPGLAQSVSGADGIGVQFDRAALHAQAVEESLRPIRPGVPGKVSFWNQRSRMFIYVPAFHFEPVRGAKVYRFTATAYGPGWTFESKDPKATLEPIWKDLPDGKLELQFTALGMPRRDALRINGPAEYKGIPFEKKPGMAPLSFGMPLVKDATAYRFTVRQPKAYVFEADQPWAALTPIWKELPVGKVVLSVEGLDRKGGKSLGYARYVPTGQQAVTFERKAVFNGPYHEPASDYIEAGERWLRWLAESQFKGWIKEGNPDKLAQYPCKYEAAAISGLVALAKRERNPVQKTQLLQMARNAARTLIKGSFPADWKLAHFPPTYNKSKGNAGEYQTVMMQYPAYAGLAYLDLYQATREKEFLDAAVRIAEVYRRTQLPNGTWHLLMDGKTGEKFAKSQSLLIPYQVIDFLERLIEEHGMNDYQAVRQLAWKWLESEVLTQFRFEGQFEDTTAGGSSNGNLSGLTAASIAKYLFKHGKDKPDYLAQAEEALRFAEDQFVIWEKPPYPEQFTPCVLEQYRYMVSVQAIAAHLMDAYGTAYETTGKELYLAKGIAIANAMTVLQKVSGGNFVNTYWVKSNEWGGWPNCHEYSARKLIEFGETLKNHKQKTTWRSSNVGHAANQPTHVPNPEVRLLHIPYIIMPLSRTQSLAGSFFSASRIGLQWTRRRHSGYHSPTTTLGTPLRDNSRNLLATETRSV
jgi:maltose/maltodextrin transport system substrate-binding protein